MDLSIYKTNDYIRQLNFLKLMITANKGSTYNTP